MHLHKMIAKLFLVWFRSMLVLINCMFTLLWVKLKFYLHHSLFFCFSSFADTLNELCFESSCYSLLINNTDKDQIKIDKSKLSLKNDKGGYHWTKQKCKNNLNIFINQLDHDQNSHFFLVSFRPIERDTKILFWWIEKNTSPNEPRLAAEL